MIVNSVLNIFFFMVICLAAVTKSKKLILKLDTEIFNLWQNFPTAAPIDFYFFNWTNPEDINNSSVKPQFEEVGPYRFLQENKKSDIVWNDNGTVSYQLLRYWYFSDEEMKNDLEDVITTVNSVAVTSGYATRSSSYFHKKGVSIVLSTFRTSISVRKTVRKLLFEGYSDELLDFLKSLMPHASKLDKFGFFYKKNASTELNGLFNIGTGENDDFAKLYSWNYKNYDKCGQISESTGDSFQPPLPKTNITFFSPDLCRVLTLEYVGEETVHGLEGYKYIIGNQTLDNGTQYSENLCFCGDECLPSGVFSVSACAEGAPFYVSLPYFSKADPWYTSEVEGLTSANRNSEFSMVIEPNTGIPLKADVRLQINMLLQRIKFLRLFDHIPRRYVLPIMWYKYKPQISPSIAALLKSYVKNNEI